jgi:plasmid stabilization system protein ParE
MTVTTIELRPEHFTEAERLLVTHGEMTASTFRYGTGVPALRVRNAAGHIDLLPFQGQQIWDAVFNGRSLTMGSMFPEPRPDTEYLGTYGAFFIHCGMTAMGNPGAGDAHPLHGEIPNAPFTARLVVGDEGGKPFMTLTGTYQDTVAFSHNYVATPTLTLRGGETSIRAELVVRNLMRKPMELMYLAHINFRPVDGSVLVDAVPDDLEHINVRTAVPSNMVQSEAHKRLLADVLANPAVHRQIGRGVDPELVMTLTYPADASGWAETMQVHPDGGADFVRHRPKELPKGVRWTTRTGDQEAIGIVLPATAEPDGYTAEKAKGNVLMLAPGAEWRCTMEFGALDPAGAAAMRKRIEAVKAG